MLLTFNFYFLGLLNSLLITAMRLSELFHFVSCLPGLSRSFLIKPFDLLIPVVILMIPKLSPLQSEELFSCLVFLYLPKYCFNVNPIFSSLLLSHAHLVLPQFLLISLFYFPFTLLDLILLLLLLLFFFFLLFDLHSYLI